MKGEVLKKLRKERGITQEDLARDIGVARSLIGMVEANRQEGGRILATKVAKYFNVSLDFLEGLTDRKDAPVTNEPLVTNFLKFLLKNGIIKDENNIDNNTKELILNMVREEIKNIKNTEK